ncbi:MAG: hypothetical protein WB249_15975 [Candidatus Sulfotelmatobacter sp.]
MGIRDWLERRRLEMHDFNRQQAVRKRQDKRELQRGITEVEKFYDDYAFHTGLDLTIPANKAQATAAMLEYFLTRGDDDEFSNPKDKGGLMNGF